MSEYEMPDGSTVKHPAVALKEWRAFARELEQHASDMDQQYRELSKDRDSLDATLRTVRMDNLDSGRRCEIAANMGEGSPWDQVMSGTFKTWGMRWGCAQIEGRNVLRPVTMAVVELDDGTVIECNCNAVRFVSVPGFTELNDAADLLEWYVNENIPSQETIGAHYLVEAVRRAARQVGEQGGFGDEP